MPPRRGTVNFMRYAVDTNELFPPYWVNQRRRAETKLFDVGWRTRDAISDLVYETWEGRAVKNMNYSELTVLDVQRVENCELFSDYRRARRRLMINQIDEEETCCPVGELSMSRERVATTELLHGSMAFLKRDLHLEVNEHYLFHGTPVGRIGALTQNGFDVRHSNPENLFGQGIYAGENSSIADSHADDRYNRSPPGHRLKMVLCRMLLGNVYVVQREQNFKQPPRNYDSVMVDGRWRHREFIVYNDCHVYPEYVITYTRQ